MTKETGKEIYLEYVTKQIYKDQVIKGYLYNEKPLSDSDEWLNGLFVPLNLSRFTRAPKTQIINGHEVIAPRYDMPSEDSQVAVYSPMKLDGLQFLTGSTYKSEYFDYGFGYFLIDTKSEMQDALAYAKAHRESK